MKRSCSVAIGFDPPEGGATGTAPPASMAVAPAPFESGPAPMNLSDGVTIGAEGGAGTLTIGAWPGNDRDGAEVAEEGVRAGEGGSRSGVAAPALRSAATAPHVAAMKTSEAISNDPRSGAVIALTIGLRIIIDYPLRRKLVLVCGYRPGASVRGGGVIGAGGFCRDGCCTAGTRVVAAPGGLGCVATKPPAPGGGDISGTALTLPGLTGARISKPTPVANPDALLGDPCFR